MSYAYDTLTRAHRVQGLYRRDRDLFTPGWTPSLDEVWWDGNYAATYGTQVTVTGSQTITETAMPPEYHITSPSSIAANDLNCILFPRTISTGQTYGCYVRARSTNSNFWMGALMFTDGTTTSSNVASSMAYVNTNGSILQGMWHGTITNLNANGGETTVLPFDVNQLVDRSTWLLRITYVSANTFNAGFAGYKNAITKATGDVSKTMTPTHVGFGWSTWGQAPSAAEWHVGPIFRIA